MIFTKLFFKRLTYVDKSKIYLFEDCVYHKLKRLWIKDFKSFVNSLEHLDRGYENFEVKLANLGVEITRELTNNVFEDNEVKDPLSNKNNFRSSIQLFIQSSSNSMLCLLF